MPSAAREPGSGDAAAAAQSAALAQARERGEQLAERLAELDELLSKPLNEILADHDRAQAAADAWDVFGAMWMLSQRAMKRVALDLAEAQGVTPEAVVSRALVHANAVLNAEEEDLGGLLAPAQLVHIARHRPALRKQFRTG
ncbi:MAG: hypothetical protein EOO24_03305 [Comamonadaceae bacterium]|nr:MAG: hypothetical protein EOO24_03305 [Comamonadaceae bacterium]